MAELTMRMLRTSLIAASIAALGAGNADAGHEAAPHPDLGQLIERFDAGAPEHDGSVQLDAWIEAGPERTEVVVVLEPQGEFKLVADPGITITPTEQPGVEWLVPLPYRHVDPGISYFTPPATVRLPFRADGEPPLEILVEYAYCVVDYQCFFGEELLTVAARYD
ncbi:MAG: hypothetical protein ACREJ5_07440 [Geminicoccaceae bacterium]